MAFFARSILSILLLATVAAAQPRLHLRSKQPSRVGGGVTTRLSPDRSHRIVQFHEPPQQWQIDELRRRGVLVTGYVPDNALAVSMNEVTSLDGLDVVWQGRLEPSDKLSPLLRENLAPDRNLTRASRGWIIEFHPGVERVAMETIAGRYGLRLVHNASLLPHHLLVDAEPGDVAVLAEWDEVAYIFPAAGELLEGGALAACPGPQTTLGLVGAYVDRAGDGWDGPGKNAAQLSYFFQTLTAKLPVSQTQQEILRAMAEWSRFARITFTAGTASNTPRTLNFIFGRGEHGDQIPFDGPSSVLAHAFFPSPPNSEPIAGDMHFDEDESWTVGADIDLFSVVLHELGHSLGLGHSDNPNAVMAPYYRRFSALTTEDTAAILDLYAAQDGVVANVAPTAVSATPSSGNVSTNTFSFVASDSNGYADVSVVEVLFNNSLTSFQGCHVYYSRSSNSLWLAANNGAAWTGPAAPGSSSMLQNSYCLVSMANSSVYGSGGSFTLNLSITFQTAFAGVRNSYMHVRDAAGSSSGWQLRGTYMVTTGTNQAPSVVSVTPQAGSGASQTFSLVYSDPDGYADLPWVQVLFNNSLSSYRACLIHYDRASNMLWLQSDLSANVWLGPAALGASASLTNSQCTANLAASSATASGTSLTLNLSLGFRPSFGGTRNVYLLTRDVAGLTTGWTQRGSWNVPGSTAPSAVGVTPSSGSGVSNVFSLVFSDQDGYDDLPWAQVLFQNSLTSFRACLVHWDRTGGALWLQSDVNPNQWHGPATVGSASTLANSQCTIHAGNTSFSASGTNLTLNLAASFSTAFTGVRNIYARAVDRSLLDSGWQQRGTWTIP